MKKPNVKTTKKVVPMIYAYTTPGISYHDGYIKIGYILQVLNLKKSGKEMLLLRMDQEIHLLINSSIHICEKME